MLLSSSLNTGTISSEICVCFESLAHNRGFSLILIRQPLLFLRAIVMAGKDGMMIVIL